MRYGETDKGEYVKPLKEFAKLKPFLNLYVTEV